MKEVWSHLVSTAWTKGTPSHSFFIYQDPLVVSHTEQFGLYPTVQVSVPSPLDPLL